MTTTQSLLPQDVTNQEERGVMKAIDAVPAVGAILAVTIGAVMELGPLEPRGALGLTAWIATGGGALMIAFAMSRTNDSRRPSEPVAPGRSVSLRGLGLEIITLLANRALPPRTSPRDGWGRQAILGNLRPEVDRRRHEAETFAIYRNLLSPRIQAEVGELVTTGAISGLEANRLCTPTGLAEVELVGLRLLDLAQRISEDETRPSRA